MQSLKGILEAERSKQGDRGPVFISIEVHGLKYKFRLNQNEALVLFAIHAHFFVLADFCQALSARRVPVNEQRVMAPQTKTKAAGEKPPRKTKSGGSGGRKKLSAFNKFMQTEMARLKDEEPEMSHQERFKTATGNWKTAKENPSKA
ncbi:putative YABBY protein [Lyophyllum shimeji]|uniref:YABBY protein n=1 Tax=Lyophyllum shimeji TaxID=47721 RepID=A0A9P3PGW7_LYOSH|nr:putative YABBY protein [Lyophyllum shimeji]